MTWLPSVMNRFWVVAWLLLAARPDVALAQSHQPVGAWPETLIVPPDGDVERHVQGVFGCPCGEAGLTLADSACACIDADEDRTHIQTALAGFTAEERRDGRASLAGAFEAAEFARLQTHLRFPEADFDGLWSTTRSVCPGEYLQIFEHGPISCRIRAMWSLRFKVMLGLGYTAEQALRFYVADSNVTMSPKTPWTERDLKYVERSRITWVMPLVGVGLILAIMALILRRNRRAAERAAARERSSSLSEDDQALLDDALDLDLRG